RAKLVDGARYDDEVKDEFKKRLGVGKYDKLNFISLNNYADAVDYAATGSERIAVIYAEGNIVDGAGSNDNIGGDAFRKLIRKVRLDKSIKAVVLRINSGGGSALASENMWRELQLTKAEKPLVVSFGDVAASGGYYMGCGADSIFASRNTITGSIGVFGVLPNMQQFFNNKLGITFDGVKTAPYADAGAIYRPVNEQEKKLIQGGVDRIYAQFLQRVAQGRKRDTAYINSIAQGRVWSGEDAVGLHLVDKIGGLQDAVDCAARMARLKSYRLREYPQTESWFNRLLNQTKPSPQALIKNEIGAQNFQVYQQLLHVKELCGSVQARLPYDFVIQYPLHLPRSSPHMPQSYNQLRAMLAITKASFRAMLRSPSAIVFSIFFPLIFILVFGFLGGSGGPTYKIVLTKNSDTANALYQSLHQNKAVIFSPLTDSSAIESELIKGRLTGLLTIQKNDALSKAPYNVQFSATTASADRFASFLPLLENTITKIDKERYAHQPTYAQLLAPQIRTVREYRSIDFILPGQLGFSLLSAGIFGVAFLFFNLRQQLVLKRFFATPLKRGYIVLGEGLSRVAFQMLTAVIIVLIGHFLFRFTLVHGLLTFIEIMILSFIALLVFMGFGFIISSVAKNESSIPPLANIITLPQFLLAGTFFSIDAFPKWLQPISRALPLTYYNDAMRKISFEGAHLTDCWLQLGVLLGWGIIAYAVAIKVFRWE
ncbi:MAG TPA: signal peptide peptidase SppA, partial [Chitinophagaceae bacterium]|nr:signal peptide peptidase SppA [Chitinophagaceae bacterium]